MGEQKALLDWHGRTAVAHAVEVVREGIQGGPVCVVRAVGQSLPALEAIVRDDPVPDRGPLVALLAGLQALEGEADVAFACGVDTPLLVPAFVRVVTSALHADEDAVVPVIHGHAQPLLAAYRVALAPVLRSLLDGGATGLRDIPGACVVRELSEGELLADGDLAASDPDLRSAANANTPAEWAALVHETRASG
jgi:molybdopterin-guanine dinucleotide biosynthesis protein A